MIKLITVYKGRMVISTLVLDLPARKNQDDRSNNGTNRKGKKFYLGQIYS